MIQSMCGPSNYVPVGKGWCGRRGRGRKKLPSQVRDLMSVGKKEGQ
jgi:hypothetical protein